MNDMRDRLTPWIIVAVMAVVLMPLIFSVACETACALGAMPLGACSHDAMSGSHSAGTLVGALPLTQPAIASATLLFMLMALLASSAGARGPVRVVEPQEERAGTRLRI